MSGEFVRIDRLLAAFRAAGGLTQSDSVPLGPGDDAALIRAAHPLAVTTDALVEGVHFRRDWATWQQVGHKTLAVNLSDLASMGARPGAFLLSLALPPDVDEQALEQIAEGMGRLAARHGAVLAGGNFSRARELSLTVTAFGEVEGTALRRDRARVGDRVLVFGPLGTAAAELRRLLHDGALPDGPSALHEPEPRIASGLLAAQHAECGIDVSDGLAQDLGHVARASGVRIRIAYDRLPTDARFRVLTEELPASERARLILAGGEDYALVVTTPPEQAGALVASGAVDVGVVELGEGVLIDGLPEGTPLGGHDHFA